MPNMRTQLVAARTVAEALADLATAPDSAPAGTSAAPIPEIAGPREERLVEMARLLAARRGDPVRIEGVTNPADPDGDLYEQGALLPGPHATLAGPTFEEWLESEPGDAVRGCPLAHCTFVVEAKTRSREEDTMKYLLQIYPDRRDA